MRSDEENQKGLGWDESDEEDSRESDTAPPLQP